MADGNAANICNSAPGHDDDEARPASLIADVTSTGDVDGQVADFGEEE